MLKRYLFDSFNNRLNSKVNVSDNLKGNEHNASDRKNLKGKIDNEQISEKAQDAKINFAIPHNNVIRNVKKKTAKNVVIE